MRIAISVTLLAILCGCQSYVAVPVQPVTLVAVNQRSRVRVFTRADVLLVIDDSFSMSGKQERLAAALQNFTAQLDALQPAVDYQVGVTTTTVSERLGACGPAGDANAAGACDSEWQAPGFACDSGLACYRGFPEAGQLRGALRRADSATPGDFAQKLAALVQVGVVGSRQPQGLEAMKLAMSGTAFLRDQAKVVVAFISDAEDCSDPGHRLAMLIKDPNTGNVVDQCAIEARGGAPGAPALEPVANYVNFLRALKNADGSAKEVEIGAVVSLADGTQDAGVCANPTCDARCDTPAAAAACQTRCAGAPTEAICLADCNAECHTFCGGQVPGRRYLELTDSFAGVAANVCSDDAAPGLQRLTAVIGIPKQIPLRAQPAGPEYVAVRVERGGQSIDCAPGTGYQLVAATDGPVVQFSGTCLLQPDDTWDIRFLASR
jgi:hypothetical protein